MAIVNVTKKDVPTKPEQQHFVKDPEYLSEVTSSVRKPSEGILAHIEGSSWIVTYYQQILGLDSNIKAFDSSLPDNLQPYTRILDFELKVSSELSSDENETTRSMTLTGSSNIYPVITPNKGDLFVADVGEGYEGIFSITDVQRLTHLKDSVFSIDYQLIARNDKNIVGILRKRSLKELYFKKDLFMAGIDPFLVKEEMEVRDGLDSNLYRLIHYYIGRFYSKSLASIVLPDKEKLIYDPFIVKVLLQIFDVDKIPQLKNIRTFNTSSINGVNDPTIWDIILKRDELLLPTISHEAKLVDIRRFSINPQLANITHTKIDYLVTSKPLFNVDDMFSTSATFNEFYFEPESRYKALGKLSNQFANDDTGKDANVAYTPLLKGLTGYVFNEAFYKGEPVYTELEILTRQHIKGQNVDLKRLSVLAEKALGFSYGEAFYYIPVIMVLIKSAIISGRR